MTRTTEFNELAPRRWIIKFHSVKISPLPDNMQLHACNANATETLLFASRFPKSVPTAVYRYKYPNSRLSLIFNVPLRGIRHSTVRTNEDRTPHPSLLENECFWKFCVEALQANAISYAYCSGRDLQICFRPPDEECTIH